MTMVNLFLMASDSAAAAICLATVSVSVFYRRAGQDWSRPSARPQAKGREFLHARISSFPPNDFVEVPTRERQSPDWRVERRHSGEWRSRIAKFSDPKRPKHTLNSLSPT